MSSQTRHLYEFGPFRLAPAERLLLREGQPVRLEPKAFEALVMLVERGGRLVERGELMRALWPDVVVEDGNVDNCVSKLRRAMGGGRGYIETVPKHGYRFVAEVRSLTPVYEEVSVERQTLTRTVTEEEVQIEDEVGVAEVAPEKGPRAPRRALPLAVGLLALSAVAALALLYRPPATTSEGRRAAAAPRPPRAIAVLPFKIIGTAAGDEEYLGLGMADALITRLGHSRQIVVRPTSAVRRYTDPHQDPVAAGRQQGVEAVLDGSIQRSGDRVRVTVQLVNVAGGEAVWSGQFDEPFTDIFAVQDAISRRVMGDLLVELNAEEQARLSRPGTENAEAFREYLMGRFFWNRRSKEGSEKAVEHFKRAIELDPAYAQAHAGLADALLLLSAGNQETVAQGRAALRRAIEIDDGLAEPHATLGMLIQNFDHDWAAAEREYKRAVELNPNYATAHHRYGEFLAHMGRFDEGVAEIRRAQELDPLSLIISADAGKVYLLARQYDRAIEQCRRALEMDPSFSMAHMLLGFAYSLKGQHEAAVAEFRRIEGAVDEGIWLSFLGYAYGAAGRRAEAQDVLERLTVLSKKTYVPPSSMMLVYAALGEKDAAFEWAGRMFDEQDFAVLGLKVNPVFDGLRADPRYALLLRRANLA